MTRKLGAIAALTMFTFLAAACQPQAATTPRIENPVLEAAVEPEPPAVGASTLVITLHDGSGNPVDGAQLSIHADMDHEGMLPIEAATNESADGVYRVPVEWTMGGGWIVAITAKLPDGAELSENFEFFVDAVSSESVISQSNRTPDARVTILYQADQVPATAGDGSVTITVIGDDGHPMTDAAVTLSGTMNHHGMVPVTGMGEHAGNGHYTVPVAWTMAGDWIVTVTVTLADGRVIEESFDQHIVSE